MTYVLHRGAEREFVEATRFYRLEAGGAVAGRFVDEFERVAQLLAVNPGLGTPTTGERRWFPLQGFPYSLIYRPIGGIVRILVVRHQSRDPDVGTGRR